MNRFNKAVICLFCAICITLTTNAHPLDSIQLALAAGDTAHACQLYKELDAQNDSLSKAAYKKEVKSYRTANQIDELYVENKIQEQAVWERMVLYALILMVLLIALFVYLFIDGRRLERSRALAERLKAEADSSMEAKRQMLNDVTGRMRVVLGRLDERADQLRTDVKTKEEILSDIDKTTEALQSLYQKTLHNSSER